MTIAIAGIVMLRWSWLKWPDVLVDFGRELYVAWRLCAGDVLYRDVAYFNPPLSPYLNALWFKLFGVGLHTLVFCNLAILIGVTALLYRLLSLISDRWAATVACLVFIALFAFGQLVEIGNYNFLCPYSHEMTHAIAFSLAAFSGLFRYLRTGKRAALVAAGFSLGAVGLTKAEVFLATGLAMAVGLALNGWRAPVGRRRALSDAMTCAGAMALPGLAAWVWLSQAMPWDVALRGLAGSWPSIVGGQVASLRFYRVLMGVADVRVSLTQLIYWTSWYIAVGLILAGASLGLRRFQARLMAGAGILIAVAITGLLGWYTQPSPWGGFLAGALRPLPLVMGALGAGFGWSLFRARQRGAAFASDVLRMVLIVWAAALLGKIILNAHIYHYGFALAMPATLLLVLTLVAWIPQVLQAAGGRGQLFRWAGLALVAIMTIGNLRVVGFWFQEKTYRVARGADEFLAPPDPARDLQSLVNYLAEQTTERETLAVLPEGVMINYLARRRNPTPYLSFLPPEMLMFGQEQIVRAFEAHPPTYIALVHRDTMEYGFRYFGRDYGRRTSQWLERHYGPVLTIGAKPLQTHAFGIVLLRYRGRSP